MSHFMQSRSHTCRRLEAEKEKQELIRQGLLEPPKPKLKLSTFSRSMGVEAAADPTMVEQQVRADQEARQQVSGMLAVRLGMLCLNSAKGIAPKEIPW